MTRWKLPYKWLRPSLPRTKLASCIATSNPRTSCCARMDTQRSSILALPNLRNKRNQPRVLKGHEARPAKRKVDSSWAQRTTCHRSRRSEKQSTHAPTSGVSASCSMRCSQVGRPLKAKHGAIVSRRCIKPNRRPWPSRRRNFPPGLNKLCAKLCAKIKHSVISPRRKCCPTCAVKEALEIQLSAPRKRVKKVALWLGLAALCLIALAGWYFRAHPPPPALPPPSPQVAT